MNVSGGGSRLAPSLASGALQVTSPAGNGEGTAPLHQSAGRKHSSGDHRASWVWSHLEMGGGAGRHINNGYGTVTPSGGSAGLQLLCQLTKTCAS